MAENNNEELYTGSGEFELTERISELLRYDMLRYDRRLDIEEENE